MTVDRDQTRRDAEVVLHESPMRGADYAHTLARACLALLSELDERMTRESGLALIEEAHRWEQVYEAARDRADAAEARLAKVPALVEALRNLLAMGQPQCQFTDDAHAALAVWEQE